ncbi:MAG: anthranilate synthase component I, partial [Pelagibacterales bacterium]|nr:anthranilate synthase component I [Pelagibacterales bacterium]
MIYQPNLKTFNQVINKNKSHVIWTTLVADLDTPVSTMIRIGQNSPYSFLLESVEGGDTKGRYSILGLNPDLIWRSFGNKAEINYDPEKSLDKFIPEVKDTFSSLRELMKISKIKIPKNLPPMASGLVGYLGFDNIKLIEKIPTNNPSKLN